MRIALMAALCALTVGSALQAQAPGRPGQPPMGGPGEVRGLVADSGSGAGIAWATVEVLRGETLVAGAIARQDGTFRIEGLQPGSYRLKVTMIGYSAKLSDFAVEAAAPRVNAGTIGLARSAIALQSLEVAAESQVVIAPDRNMYRARDIAPAAATATDVLESVPSVQVDADGKLSLRGNENLVVQINGRPTPIRGAQLAAYLKQLPASTIERVEVIPNPSARQDPEGMAGILNIVLKQTVDLGRSGGLTLAGATSGRFAGSGNFGYQAGKVTLFTTYGYSTDERDVTGINDRTRLGSGGVPLWFTEQDVDGTQVTRGHNASANLEYRLDRRNSLYTTAMFNARRSSDESVNATSELNGSRSVIELYDRTRSTHMKNGMVDGTVGFRRVVTPQQNELSAELRLNRQDDRDLTSIWRIPANGLPIDGETNDTDALTRQLTAQFDLTRMIGKGTKLETGYKGNARWIERDFQVLTDDAGDGTWLPGALSNELTLDEQVHAVYGVVSHAIGKVQLQAGLRAEHAEREFSLADGTTYPFTYRSLFPSALASVKLNDRTEAKASYSRRVRRPGTQELNPFPAFFDAQNVFIGNPSLGPEYTDAFELGLQRSGRMGSLQLSPFYRRTTDIIRVDINTADTVMNREVTSITFRNLATSESYGADLNAQFRLSPKFSGLAAFNVFKMVTDGGSESSLQSDALNWTARVNASYVVSPITTLQAMYFYRAPMNFERGKFSAMSMMNLAVRQKLRGDGLTATVRVSDPFDTSRFRAEVGDDNLFQLTNRSFNNRAIHLTVQAAFGQAPRVRQPRQDDAPAPQTGFPGGE